MRTISFLAATLISIVIASYARAEDFSQRFQLVDLRERGPPNFTFATWAWGLDQGNFQRPTPALFTRELEGGRFAGLSLTAGEPFLTALNCPICGPRNSLQLFRGYATYGDADTLVYITGAWNSVTSNTDKSILGFGTQVNWTAGAGFSTHYDPGVKLWGRLVYAWFAPPVFGKAPSGGAEILGGLTVPFDGISDTIGYKLAAKSRCIRSWWASFMNWFAPNGCTPN
jgi:hypothetical protein